MEPYFIDLPGLLDYPREEIYAIIKREVKERFGENVILTGINDYCVDHALKVKKATFGFCLDEIEGVFDDPTESQGYFEERNCCLQELLDYVNRTVIVYDKEYIRKIGNMQYKLLCELPSEAILGFIRLDF
jgi:hypothetical protein